MLAAPALLLAGCATPADRISTALGRYGLDAQRARCVGDHLQKHLSLGQLRQLGRAAAAYQGDSPRASPLDAGDLVRAAGQLHDPEVPLELGRAGLACDLLSVAR